MGISFRLLNRQVGGVGMMGILSWVDGIPVKALLFFRRLQGRGSGGVVVAVTVRSKGCLGSDEGGVVVAVTLGSKGGLGGVVVATMVGSKGDLGGL